ncbi:MAG: AAA family ATPase, partial [Methylovulum sp.]|nr:AAA family ATPase [Methylovulum sp.]
MLNSLVIKNFRMLEDFSVAKLGRLNLIVGKNNSGKSSVLEALRIYAGEANVNLLKEIAENHNEKFPLAEESNQEFNAQFPYEDLFTGRQPS